MSDDVKKPEEEEVKDEEVVENTEAEENTEVSEESTDGDEAVEGEVVGSGIIVDDSTSDVRGRTIEQEMEESYLEYSMSVIVSRALPDVRDGLKPVHRRILHSMNTNGNRATSKHRKSARIVGDVMGKYHPHGDSAIYESMARMAQDWSMRYTMVDGQGNFGSMDGDSPAAMRYTEARMTGFADVLLTDIDKETVDFRPNFDGSETEPSVLPAKAPNLLLNGQIGIAVGMATSIPPHNLGELIDATVEIIDNPDATLDDLLKHVKGPDFPTGAEAYGGESMRAAYATGKGSVVMRATAEIKENPSKKGRYQVVIDQVPYGVRPAAVIEKIAELVRDKKIKGISDLRDLSSRGKLQLVVDIKKDGYPKKILNQLYKMTQLQSSFHYNMMALVDGIQPQVLGLEDILKEYIKHRQVVVRRRTEFELKKAEARAHILEGLSIALDNIDAVIKTIRASKTSDEAQAALMKQFKLSEIQSKAILAMQLRRLTGLERQEIEDELRELKKLIKELQGILADEKKVLAIIKTELTEVKDKYADKRRTKIFAHDLGSFNEEDLIADEAVVVTRTSGGYIKRSLASEYRRQNRGGKGKRGMVTKEEDVIEQVIFASTHDMLLFFTNRGRVFKLKTYEVPASSLTAKGIAAVNLLQLQPEETISSIIKLPKKIPKDNYLFMATTAGTVKKTKFSDYDNIRTSGLIAIKLVEGDELKWVRLTNGDNEIIISTTMGRSIRFHEKDARPMGRNAKGVRGIKLKPDDRVIAMDVIVDKANILVVSENGYGKRTNVSQFTAHKRGGVGIKTAIVNKKTGNLKGVRAIRIEEYEEIIIISKNGQTVRIALADISTMSRTTQGVRIMKLNAGDTVASMTFTLKDDGEDPVNSEEDKSADKPKKTTKTKK